MCLSKPKMPKPPPLPAPPPEPPKIVDAAVTRARDDQMDAARAMAGYASTNLTGTALGGQGTRKGGKTALGG